MLSTHTFLRPAPSLLPSHWGPHLWPSTGILFSCGPASCYMLPHCLSGDAGLLGLCTASFSALIASHREVIGIARVQGPLQGAPKTEDKVVTPGPQGKSLFHTQDARAQCSGKLFSPPPICFCLENTKMSRHGFPKEPSRRAWGLCIPV